MERPTFCTEEHLDYLDDLRESGVTNMFGGAPYLKNSFNYLSKDESRKILFYWMDTFSERHS